MRSVRARTVISVAGLAVYALLAAGSLGGPAVRFTLQQVILHRKALFQLASATMHASESTTSSIDKAYRDLGGYMAAEKLSTSEIIEMERTRDALKLQADSLRAFLGATEATADQLFEMLESRAKENQTQAWRGQMLDDIRGKQDQFSERLDTAREAMKRIDASIQKYDDIVGYVQVNFGLKGIDQQIGQLDSVISEAGALDQQIQLAINEGLQIINTLDVPVDAAEELAS